MKINLKITKMITKQKHDELLQESSNFEMTVGQYLLFVHSMADKEIIKRKLIEKIGGNNGTKNETN